MTDTPRHKYYDIACRAYNWSSFSPEKRAVSDCEWYDGICQKLKEANAEWAIEKFTRLFLKGLAAKSRCASPMITGPARFPVARMQKYNQWERNASDAMITFVNKVLKPPTPPRTELDYKIDQKEYNIGDVRVLQNVEANRLQLFYPDKPDDDMRSKLKSHGFKWSPRNTAWQRQLTPNALRVIKVLLPENATA